DFIRLGTSAAVAGPAVVQVAPGAAAPVQVAQAGQPPPPRFHPPDPPPQFHPLIPRGDRPDPSPPPPRPPGPRGTNRQNAPPLSRPLPRPGGAAPRAGSCRGASSPCTHICARSAAWGCGGTGGAASLPPPPPCPPATPERTRSGTSGTAWSPSRARACTAS